MGYKDPQKQREYARRWMAERRASFFKDKVCVTCGANDRLELDHIDPSLKEDHKIWSWSEQRRNEELAKCQVLCHGCHLQKTIKQLVRSHSPIHGTHNEYAAHKCRCELCTEAQRLYNREIRKKQKEQ